MLMHKILTTSIAYTCNLMFFSGLIILMTICGQGLLAAEIGLVYSIVVSVGQIFSYNVKSIILFDNNKKFANEVINFRILLGILIFFFSFLILKQYKINFSSNDIILALILILIQNWVLEIYIIINEVNKSYRLIKFYNLCSFINILLVVINILLLQNKFLLEIFFYIIFINSFFIILFFNIKNIGYFNFISIFNSVTKLFSLSSSFSIILSVLFWRVFIYMNLEKEIVGILYSSFSIGSFAGTLLSNIAGPSIIKKKISLIFYLRIYFYVVTIICAFVFFLIYYETFFFQLTTNQLFFIKSINYSILGSPLMLFSIIYRLDYFYSNKNNRNYIFKNDILNSIVISILPVLLINFSQECIILSYFLSSIISFTMSYILYKHIKKL
jgi:hypothetical protein